MQIDRWDKNLTSNIYNFFYIIIMLICYVSLIKLYSTPLTVCCFLSFVQVLLCVLWRRSSSSTNPKHTLVLFSKLNYQMEKRKENEKQKRPATAAVLLRPLFHICTLHVLVQSSDNCTQFSFFARGSLAGEELGDIMNYIYFRWYVRHVTQNDVCCDYQDKYISNEQTRDSGEQYKCS